MIFFFFNNLIIIPSVEQIFFCLFSNLPEILFFKYIFFCYFYTSIPVYLIKYTKRISAKNISEESTYIKFDIINSVHSKYQIIILNIYITIYFHIKSIFNFKKISISNILILIFVFQLISSIQAFYLI